MRNRWAVLVCLCLSLGLSAPAQANTGDIPSVIEGFMAKQYPGARSHHWVVNGTQWQTENEVVVDVNAIVLSRVGQAPTESRFLLLIVEGKLAAAQNIPLDASSDCQPMQT